MTCPFCSLEKNPIADNTHALAIRDRFPVSNGHTLIIPKRHVASFFELDREERIAVLDLLDTVRTDLITEFKPEGFNIGINDGEAAGQTIMHLHVHVIPRYKNDVLDPRGGIRLVFPDKADYWSEKS